MGKPAVVTNGMAALTGFMELADKGVSANALERFGTLSSAYMMGAVDQVRFMEGVYEIQQTLRASVREAMGRSHPNLPGGNGEIR